MNHWPGAVISFFYSITYVNRMFIFINVVEMKCINRGESDYITLKLKRHRIRRGGSGFCNVLGS